MIKTLKEAYKKSIEGMKIECKEDWEKTSKTEQRLIRLIILAATIPVGISALIVGNVAGRLAVKDLINRGYMYTEDWKEYWSQIAIEEYNNIEKYSEALRVIKLIKKLRERMVDTVIYNYYVIQK